MRHLDAADAAIQIPRDKARIVHPRTRDRNGAGRARSTRHFLDALEIVTLALRINECDVKPELGDILDKTRRSVIRVEHRDHFAGGELLFYFIHVIRQSTIGVIEGPGSSVSEQPILRYATLRLSVSGRKSLGAANRL